MKINLPIRLESDLMDDASGTKIISLGEKTSVTDTVKYDHLKVYNRYRLETEIFYTDKAGNNISIGSHTETVL